MMTMLLTRFLIWKRQRDTDDCNRLLRRSVFQFSFSPCVYAEMMYLLHVTNGRITALSNGSSTITASIGTTSDNVTIILYTQAERFTLSESEIWLVAKEQYQLQIDDLQPKNADPIITWSSSDVSSATIIQLSPKGLCGGDASQPFLPVFKEPRQPL